MNNKIRELLQEGGGWAPKEVEFCEIDLCRRETSNGGTIRFSLILL